MMGFHNKAVRWFGVIAVLAVMLAVGGAAVLWFPAGELGAHSDTGDDAGVLAAALSITIHSSTLVAANSAPTDLDMIDPDIDPVEAIAAIVDVPLDALDHQKLELEKHLETMSGKGYDDRVGRIENLVNQLVANTEQIIQERPRLLREQAKITEIRRDVGNYGFGLIAAAITSADGQYYYLMDDLLKWTYQNDVRRYSNSELVAQNAGGLVSALGAATVVEDRTFVPLAHENYTSTANRVRQSVQYLSANYGDELDPRVVPLSEELLGIGNDAFFENLEDRLRLVAAEEALLADNAATLDLLLVEIEGLSAVVQGRTPPSIPPSVEESAGVPGVTDDNILFGQSAALSGPSGELGIEMRLGIRAAFTEANQSGGVHGRTLGLVTRNDAYESQLAFENTVQLIERDGVFGLIGAVGTPTSRAASPVAQAEGAPFIGPFTGANFLRDGELDNVVNYRASYYQETEQMVERLTQDLGVTRVAVLYQNDSYGLDGLEGVRRALARRGLEPVASWHYMRNTNAVKRAAFHIAEAEPEAVIMISSYAPAAEAIELLRSDLEPDPIFLAVSFVGSEALADELGPEGAGVYVTQVVPLPDGESSEAVRNYRAALASIADNAEPGFTSLEGYLVGRLAIAGLEACGPDLTRSCFLHALRDAEAISIDDIQLQYGPGDNQGSDEVLLTVLGVDGNYRQVDGLTRTAVGSPSVQARPSPGPAPGNVTAVNGPESGQAILRWTPAPGATFYRVGWLAVEDYEANRANDAWRAKLSYSDVTLGSSHTVSRLTPGIEYFFIVGAGYHGSWVSWPTTWNRLMLNDDS